MLIQPGGFGFMTGSTLLLLLVVGRRTALSDRILAQESAGARDLGSVRTVLRRVAAFTLIAEGIGAIALGVAFAIRYGDAAKGAWYGVFHSISAFNNAGFDLLGGFDSLGAFAADPLVLVPLAVLIVLGGLGVAIVGDLAAKRGWIRLALETKLVVADDRRPRRRRDARPARVRVVEPARRSARCRPPSGRSTPCSSRSRSAPPG